MSTQVLENPISKRKLKPTFGAMGYRAYSPRPPERARTLVLGLRKTGKSSFAASNPVCAVLDFEGGAHSVKNPQAYIFPIQPTADEVDSGKPREGYDSLDPWQRYQAVKKALLADAKSGDPQFKTVAIDSVDAMVEFMIGEFCKEKKIDNLGDYKDGRAGWFEVRSPFQRELLDFDYAGYGLIMISHLAERVVNENLVVQPKLSNSFREALLMMADQIVHTEFIWESKPGTKTVKIGNEMKTVPDRENRIEESRVVLRTISKPNDRERGCRVQIPDGLVLPDGAGWAAYAEAYLKEVERVKSEVGQN